MNEEKSIFELLDQLRQNGASETEIYFRIHSFLEKKSREAGIPSIGHFELTPLCNFACKMCYVHMTEAQMKNSRLLDSSTWIMLMQQAIEAGMTSATLSGGECLTYSQFDDVYLFLKSQGIGITVLTNGFLLNGERIDFFKQHLPSLIQVSLYGNSEEAYEKVTGKKAFATVVKNILEAKEAGLPICIGITPSIFMKEALKETIEFANELAIPYFMNACLLTPRAETGREKHDLDLDEYIEISKFRRQLDGVTVEPRFAAPVVQGCETEYENTGLKCGAGKSGFSLRWNGNMYPCGQLDSIVAYPLKDGFSAAWESINLKVNSFPQFKKCDKCIYSQVCNFCAAENEKMGSRYRLDPFWCIRTWKMVEKGLKPMPQENGNDNIRNK